jgi:hypothetical protein
VELCLFSPYTPSWRGQEELYFIGAFKKKKKATISFIMSVCMEPLHSHWTDFYEIWYLNIFKKIVKKIHISDKNNGYFT